MGANSAARRADRLLETPIHQSDYTALSLQFATRTFQVVSSLERTFLTSDSEPDYRSIFPNAIYSFASSVKLQNPVLRIHWRYCSQFIHGRFGIFKLAKFFKLYDWRSKRTEQARLIDSIITNLSIIIRQRRSLQQNWKSALQTIHSKQELRSTSGNDVT